MAIGNIKLTKKSKAAAEGSHEWLTERVMALFSIPLVIWLVHSLVTFQTCGCYKDLVDFLKVPVNSTLMVMLLGFFFTYLYMALKVVFEDYIRCNYTKWTLIIATKFISIFAFVYGVLAILKIFLK